MYPLEKVLGSLLERGYRSEALRDGDWQDEVPPDASEGKVWEWECAVCQWSGRDVGRSDWRAPNQTDSPSSSRSGLLKPFLQST